MPTQTVAVTNKLGLHARPAALFVKIATRYQSEVFVSKVSDEPGVNGAGFEANGKSIMGVMMLQAETGSALQIRTEGPDADDALAALVSLVESRFGEE